MSILTHLNDGVFSWILQTTWQAAVLAVLIVLAQRLLRNRLSPAWRYGLWLLLVVRLLMPAVPPSAWSIFNLARAALGQSAAVTEMNSYSVAGPNVIVNSFNGTPSLSVSGAPAPRFHPGLIPPEVVVRSDWNLDWFGLALCGWLAGVCFFGARLVWTNWRFRARLGAYQPVADENVTRLLDDCRAAFKITQPVRLIESEEVESPAVYGFWRKWLLLPDGVFERFSPEELRCIFLHELAHIKRRDLAVNWLVAGLQVLHWFNPFLWLSWARMRADRELATDALALAHVRESDHALYGETILKVLEGLAGEQALPGSVGILESKAQLKERIIAITRPGKYWKWAALAAVAFIAGVGLTGAQTGKTDLTGSLALTNVKLEPQDLSAAAAEGALRGHVVDSDGHPIATAVIHLRRFVGKDGESVSMANEADPVAVSDAQGNITLTTPKAFDRLSVAVQARGFAPKDFNELKAGTSPELVLTEGVSLQGRVLCQGKPLTHVTVRTSGTGGHYYGMFAAETDADGRFQFVNLPPNARYRVTGLREAMQAYGALRSAEVQAGGDGSVMDLGDLTVEPGYTLAGRVALSDGQPLPPKTWLRLISGWPGPMISEWVDLDKEGHFSTGGIAGGEVSLRADAPGYHFSEKNASLPRQNPIGLLGRVDHDITNLFLLLDKGPPPHSQPWSSSDNALRQRPLEGAEKASR